MTELHPADDLVALALGDLEPVARDHVLRHLSTCLGCRGTYDALAATVEATLAAAPQVDPPLGFEDRALAAMGIAAPAPSPEPAPTRPGRFTGCSEPAAAGGRSPLPVWSPGWRSGRSRQL